jgi:hypothetical protein
MRTDRRVVAIVAVCLLDPLGCSSSRTPGASSGTPPPAGGTGGAPTSIPTAGPPTPTTPTVPSGSPPAAPDAANATAPAADAATAAADARVADAAAGTPSYGGVGQLPPIPLQYTAQPVPPLVQPECPDDPTQGFTEYEDSFQVQRPYDLAAADRFSYQDGIYTFWVFPGDKPHAMGNTTAPRTEARYSNMSTGEHLWSADMMFEAPLTHTAVMQIHNVTSAIAAYFQVNDGDMRNAAGGGTVLTGAYGKWFNLKVAFNTQTHEVRTWINNCLKGTTKAPAGSPNWYFKNGVYTCNAMICRDHYKNIHLYQRGSTDKPSTVGTGN